MKALHSFKYIFILFAAFLLITACSSDDNTVAESATDPDTPADPVEPPPDPTVTAPLNLAGIWEGTLTTDTLTLDVAMAFLFPDGATEGRVMGIAVDQTQQPYIMFDSGYQDVSNFNWDYEYVIGRFGAQGTSLKSFLFEDNFVGNLSGGFELSLDGNTLSGNANFDELGEFVVELEYSLQNLNDATLADLAGTWFDAEPSNGWDDAATDTTVMIDDVNTVMSGSATGTTCVASGPVYDTIGSSIFLFGNPDSDNKTYITLENCGDRTFNEGTLNPITVPVDGAYDGMGVLVDDGSGNTTLVLMLSSTLEKKPSMGTYNEMIKN